MDPTWQLLPDELSRDVFNSPLDPPIPEVSLAHSRLTGHGLLRPFKRDSAGDFRAGNGIALVRAAVGLVLGTVCQSETTSGELPWRPEFGSLLTRLRLRNNDGILRSAAKRYVVDALARWVPSVEVRGMEFVTSRDDRLLLKINYEIVDLTGNRVLVSGLQTAVALG